MAGLRHQLSMRASSCHRFSDCWTLRMTLTRFAVGGIILQALSNLVLHIFQRRNLRVLDARGFTTTRFSLPAQAGTHTAAAVSLTRR